jgi:hypothetical protein
MARRHDYCGGDSDADADSESESNSRTTSRQRKDGGRPSSKCNSDYARRTKMAHASKASKPINTDSESSTSDESENDYLVKKPRKTVKTKRRKARKPIDTDSDSSYSSSCSSSSLSSPWSSSSSSFSSSSCSSSLSSSSEEPEDKRLFRKSKAKAKKMKAKRKAKKKAKKKAKRAKENAKRRKSAKKKAKEREAKKTKTKKKAMAVDSETSDSSDSGTDGAFKMQKHANANKSVKTGASGPSNAIDSMPDAGVDHDLVVPNAQSSKRKPEAMRWSSIGAAHAANGNAEGSNEARPRVTVTVNGRGKVIAATPQEVDFLPPGTTLSRHQRSPHASEELDQAVHKAKPGVHLKRWTGRASGKSMSVVVVVVADRR